MLKNFFQSCILKWKHMTPTTFKYVKHFIPLHIKTQTIISNTPMCYIEFYDVNKISLLEMTYVDKYYHVDNEQTWRFWNF